MLLIKKSFQHANNYFIFRPRTGFDSGSIDRLEQLFRQTVGNGKEIKREDFKKIVVSKNVSNLFHNILLITILTE